MDATTIKLKIATKTDLDRFREYKNESYDEVIKKVLYIAKNADSNLSNEAIEMIDKARKRMKKGNFVTEEEAAARLGF